MDFLKKVFGLFGDEISDRSYAVPNRVPDNENYSSLKWVSASSGNVPPNAVQDGKSVQGEVLYVGRAKHGMQLEDGKVFPSRRCLIICINGLEHEYSEYEVMVNN